MSLGLGPGLKRGWTDRETDPGLHRWWPSTRQAGSEGRKEKGEPGAAGLAEAGMGPSMADADARQPRVEGRRRERLRHRDRETERGSVPALLQVQPGAADLDLNRRQPGDATDTATPLVWNRGWGSGPRSVPTRQRTGGAVASFRHRVAPEIGARP